MGCSPDDASSHSTRYEYIEYFSKFVKSDYIEYLRTCIRHEYIEYFSKLIKSDYIQYLSIYIRHECINQNESMPKVIT